MHKYILIPDSFKGTLSARDFCAVAREAIGRADPGAQVLSIPLADGGEGTVEAFLAACGGRRIECPCTGPYGGTAPGFYGLLPDGTAVVELAAAAGLPLAGTDLHPAEATTYGVGQLLLHAARHGARRLLLGLGGSATNDGGCGAAAALGVEFYDRRGRDVLDMPGGGAAGGFGAGAAALLNARLRPGVEMLLDAADFPRLAADADLIITGEGRLDSQSLGGKAVIGVARRARELGVPCAALAGAVDVSVLPRAYELGLTAAFPINPLPLPFEQVRVSCRENLSAAVENLIRFYCSVAR